MNVSNNDLIFDNPRLFCAILQNKDDLVPVENTRCLINLNSQNNIISKKLLDKLQGQIKSPIVENKKDTVLLNVELNLRQNVANAKFYISSNEIDQNIIIGLDFFQQIGMNYDQILYYCNAIKNFEETITALEDYYKLMEIKRDNLDTNNHIF